MVSLFMLIVSAAKWLRVDGNPARLSGHLYLSSHGVALTTLLNNPFTDELIAAVIIFSGYQLLTLYDVWRRNTRALAPFVRTCLWLRSRFFRSKMCERNFCLGTFPGSSHSQVSFKPNILLPALGIYRLSSPNLPSLSSGSAIFNVFHVSLVFGSCFFVSLACLGCLYGCARVGP